MQDDDLTFIERRRKQSLSQSYVDALAKSAALEERIVAVGKSERSGFARIDTTNILKIILQFGKNKLPYGTGKFVHSIEIAKTLGLFKEDAKNEHYDSGVLRVQRLMMHVNKKLLLQKSMLANWPAAGYRIASQEEGVIEIKKALLRSFGNALGALGRSRHGIDLSQLNERDSERFPAIQRFTEHLFIEFKNELEDAEVAANGYVKRKTKQSYQDPMDEVFRSPPI